MSTKSPSSDQVHEVSRRGFLKTAAVGSAGLVFGLHLPMKQSAASSPMVKGGDFVPNAFVQITSDNLVTITSKHVEFGQGPLTGLATIVAEELDAAWNQVRAKIAPSNVELYAHTVFPSQSTGGSSAIANSYQQMRKAGATARAMLLEAAAAEWKVPASSLTVVLGVITDPKSRRSKPFGELVEAAALLDPPTDVTLKDPKDFKLIGTMVPKLDTRAKTTGETLYTIDLKRPGMWTVLVSHPPRFGARVASVNDAKARKVAGVQAIEVIPEGVAVYALGFWSAKQARDLLEIEWQESGTESRSSEEIISEYQTLAKTPGLPASKIGDAEAAVSKSATVLSAEYVFPFLAHAPMEPLDCIVEKQGDRYEIWMGSQGVTRDHERFAKTLGVSSDQITLHVEFSGGSFGRRSQPHAEFAGEAAHVSMAIDGRAPIKLVWTREDDIRGGFYRPIYVHRLRGAIDEHGQIQAWQQVIVGQSIQKGGALEKYLVQDGIDVTSVEGASNLSYRVPNLDVSLHSPELGVPVLWWRSVGHTHTGYTSETFIDALLEKAGKDAVAGRLELLGEHPRHRGVLSAVAKMAGWGGSVPKGRARGVAVHESFGSFVAEIAEVSRSKQGRPKVERVWCAVDCGIAINPDIVKAQMEGGIGYGLGAALMNEITLKDGRVDQSNFHDYTPLRIDDMPDIEVMVVKSAEPPTGVGEPGVPPIAPAVANAWAALTGKRLTRLPFSRAST